MGVNTLNKLELRDCWEQIDKRKVNLEDDNWFLLGNAKLPNVAYATNREVAELIAKVSRKRYVPISNKIRLAENKWMMQLTDGRVYAVVPRSDGTVSVYVMLIARIAKGQNK